MNRKRINRWTAIGEPPSETQLRSISLADYRSVVNLRGERDEGIPLPPHREAVMAKSLGLGYREIDLAGGALGEEEVARFRDAVRGLERPVFVHSRDAERMQALALIHVALESGWKGDEALAHGDEIGLVWKAADLREFVKAAVDREKG